MNPFASFDCLGLGTRLQGALGDTSDPELHMFAYLSCLLWLYRGHPVSDWGYSFTGTREGAPFSTDMEHALVELATSGHISDDPNHRVVTPGGSELFAELRELTLNRTREPYLEGACSTALAFPPGRVRDALVRQPELKRAHLTGAATQLLDDRTADVMYGQFQQLSQALGVDTHDLMIPATVWVEYLLRAEPAPKDARP